MTVKRKAHWSYKSMTYVKQKWTSPTARTFFSVRLSYDRRSLQVTRGFASGLHLFGFVLEGEGLLQLSGNVKGVEVSNLPNNRL